MAEVQQGMKVYPTWEILEKVNLTEWLALKKDDKEIFQLLISAGTLYFTDGGKMRDILLVMFPIGTATGDKLRLM